MDLTPAPALNPFGTGGGGGTIGGLGEESPRFAFGGAEPDGNLGGGLGGVNDGRSTSASRDLAGALEDVNKEEEPKPLPLVYFANPPGVAICGGVITGGHGIRRCCLQPVIPGTGGCGTGSHKTKAAVAARGWHLTVVIRGNLRAGLVDKRLERDDILEEDSEIFSTEAHSAVGWLTRFQTSKLAKLGAGISLRAQTATGIPAYVGIREYAGSAISWRPLVLCARGVG
jgi:hypothetical protein